MNHDQFPLVSIIITSYNRAAFIGKAIESALMQDYQNFEIIITDNCSTDNSDAVITSFKDSRIKYSRNDSNIGMIPNFQKGISLARGEYITFISSDDYLTEPGFISLAISLFNKYENVAFVKGRTIWVRTGDNSIIDTSREYSHPELLSGKDIFLNYQWKAKPLGFDACVINKKMLQTLDICFDPKMFALDREINLNLCLKGDVAHINQVCYAIRVHDSRTTLLADDEVWIANMSILERAINSAKKLNSFDPDKLRDWYDNVIYRNIKDLYLVRYMQGFDTHEKFEKTFSSKYPKLYKKVKNEKQFLFLRIFYNRYYNFFWVFKFIKPGFYSYQTQLQSSIK